MDSWIRRITRDIYGGKELISYRIIYQLLRAGNYQVVAQMYMDLLSLAGPIDFSMASMFPIIAASRIDIEKAISIAEKISKRLEEANGRRRVRLLTHENIATTLFTANETDQYTTALGGTVGFSYGYVAYTTAALCFRPFRSRTFYLDIKECYANASMGACWPILGRPWYSSTRSSVYEAGRLNRLEAWTRNSTRLRVPKYLSSLVVNLLNNYWRSEGTSDWITDTLEDPASFLLRVAEMKLS